MNLIENINTTMLIINEMNVIIDKTIDLPVHITVIHAYE